MALIKCKDCKKEFSTDAKRCPHCGANKPIKRWSGKTLLIILVGIPLLGILTSPSQKHAPSPGASPSPTPVTVPAAQTVGIKWPDKPNLPAFKDSVAFSIQFYDSGDMKPAIIGYTNLPEGTKMMVDVSRKKASYFGQSEAFVRDGRLQTENFTVSGAPLPPGTYKVEISTPLPGIEPASVQQVIGKRGENLKGKWTTSSYGEKMVRFSTNLELGNGESKQADAEAIQRKKQEEEQRYQEKLAKIPDAKLMCKEFVRKQLHDPDSAEFEDYNTYPAEYVKKDGVYKVQVFLRARNAFNALRRGVFECQAMPWSADGKWILVKLRQIQ